MEGKSNHLPPGDPQLITNIVNHLKSQGIFDEFRRDLLADADTKPSYQNLRQRVEGYASKFLSQQTWQPDLNKNQLRDTLRRQINESDMLASGVDHVLEQLIGPKIFHVFLPQVETLVKEYLGLKEPPPPPPVSILENVESIAKDLPAVTTAQKKNEPESVSSKSSIAASETPTPKIIDGTPINVEIKLEKDDGEDSVLISESGAEQSDSSMLDYSGPMGKTPPPPGVSEDELNSFQYFEEDSRTKEKAEIIDFERERESAETDSKESTFNQEQEPGALPEKMEIDSDDKPSESTKASPTDKVKKTEKSNISSQTDKYKTTDRERSRSSDSSKSKHSESKTAKVEKHRFSENSPQKIQEKSKKQDGSALSKLKHSSSSGLKKQENIKLSQESGKHSETKVSKPSSESQTTKPDKHKTDNHSSKSLSGSSSSKSSKSKHISSTSKSGKTEAYGKTMSSTTKSSNLSKAYKHTSSEIKSKHSEKHAHKSKHSGDSSSNSSKEDKPRSTKSESSEEKVLVSKQHGGKSQGHSRDSSTSQKHKEDRKKSSKEVRKSLDTGLEEKSCKDGHGCPGKTLSSRKHALPESSQTQERSPSHPEKTGEAFSSEESCRVANIKRILCDKPTPETCSSEECHNSDINRGEHLTTKLVTEASERADCPKHEIVETINTEESLSSPTTSSNFFPRATVRGLSKFPGTESKVEGRGSVPKESSSEANGTGSEDRGDILREILMDKKNKDNQSKSDISVSSVHTSDLSSFDDAISLSSVDEIEIPEMDTKKKKVPLKEVKEIAAVILKEKSNSSGRSTPVMSSVEQENNKQDLPHDTEGQNNEQQSEEEQDNSKISLRRKRRVNPKYASEEYSSIFNEGTNASFESDDNQEEIPSRMSTQEPNANQEDLKHRHSSKDSDPETKPKATKISRRKRQSSETVTEPNSTAEHTQRSSRERRSTRSNSDNQDGSENCRTPTETSRKKQRSHGSVHGTPDTTKQENHRTSTSSQRYDSSDLYKPRPVISSRRSRNSQESQNTQLSSAIGRSTRQSSPLSKRRR